MENVEVRDKRGVFALRGFKAEGRRALPARPTALAIWPVLVLRSSSARIWHP